MQRKRERERGVGGREGEKFGEVKGSVMHVHALPSK